MSDQRVCCPRDLWGSAVIPWLPILRFRDLPLTEIRASQSPDRYPHLGG